MKKWIKTMAALTAAVCLTFTFALAGCKDPEEPEEHTTHIDENGDGLCDVCGEEMGTTEPVEVKITDGRWETISTGPDRDDSGGHLKLKEDGTFYMYSAWVDTMGSWELVDEEKKYYEINMGDPYGETPPEEIAGLEEKTAPQTLVLTAYDGATYVGAYADGRIWNMQRPTLQGISYETMVQNAEYEWNESVDEVAITDYTLCLPKDGSKTIIIDASMTSDGTMYDNLGETPVNGTYTKTEAEDGTVTYSLKDGGTEYATLVVSGETYTYTLSGEEPVTLVTEAWTADFTLTTENQEAVSVTLAGESASEDVLVMLRLWEDMTADVAITQMSGSFSTYTVLSGTYEGGENGELVLTFGDETFTSTAPAEGNVVSVDLTLPAGDVLAEGVDVTLLGEFALVYVERSFTAENVQVTGISGLPEGTALPGTLTLDLYNDGTAVLSLSISMGAMNATGVVDTGTYTMDTSGMIPAVTVTFETAGEVAAAPDYAGATPSGIPLDIIYTAEAQSVSLDTGVGDPVAMALTFTGTMRWMYTIG